MAGVPRAGRLSLDGTSAHEMRPLVNAGLGFEATTVVEKKNLYKGWFIAMTIAMFAFLALFIVYALNYGSAVAEADHLRAHYLSQSIPLNVSDPASYISKADSASPDKFEWFNGGVGGAECYHCFTWCYATFPSHASVSWCQNLCYDANSGYGPGHKAPGCCYIGFGNLVDGYFNSNENCQTATSDTKGWGDCAVNERCVCTSGEYLTEDCTGTPIAQISS